MMLRQHLLWLPVALSACTTVSSRSSPAIVVMTDDTSTDRLALIIGDATKAWSTLGIEAPNIWNENLRECPERWFDDPDSLPCDITIAVSFASNSLLNFQGGETNHTDRMSTIANDLPSDSLTQSVISREIGFSIFDTSDTLPAGEFGIMSAELNGTTTPTQVDLTFAESHTDGWVHS